MKTFISFLLSMFLFIGITSKTFASNTTLDSINNTTLTVEKVYEDVKAGITGLALALKAPAEHVYQIMVKQQIVNSWSYLLGFLGTFVISFFIMLFLIKEQKKDNYDDEWSLICLIVLGIVNAILLVIFLCNLDIIIGGFINPEYGAIKDIIHFIK